MARKMSVAEAAAESGCNAETIRRAIRSHELPASVHPTKPGRPFEIDAADLKAFLDARRASRLP
jgi:excisionase family DNA binding protein